MLYVVSDHGGFTLKQRLVAWLQEQGYSVTDLGPTKRRPNDDYPLAARQLARAVQISPKSFGIAVCRTGVGMAIVTNKHRGIRAVQGTTIALARRSRQDENTNVLSLAADYQTLQQSKRIISIWLATPFKGQRRHVRRLHEIKKIEHAR